MFAHGRVFLGEFQDGGDIVFHAHLAEYRGFLSQVADTQFGSFVHGEPGNVHIVQEYLSFQCLDEADYDVKGSGLAGAVRSEKPDYLALFHFYVHMVHHSPLVVHFHDVFGS